MARGAHARRRRRRDDRDALRLRRLLHSADAVLPLAVRSRRARRMADASAAADRGRRAADRGALADAPVGRAAGASRLDRADGGFAGARLSQPDGASVRAVRALCVHRDRSVRSLAKGYVVALGADLCHRRGRSRMAASPDRRVHAVAVRLVRYSGAARCLAPIDTQGRHAFVLAYRRPRVRDGGVVSRSCSVRRSFRTGTRWPQKPAPARSPSRRSIDRC